MPENYDKSRAGYYRTSPKEAKARTARIKERRVAAATPEGKKAIKERLLSQKATREASMTPGEIRKSERKRIELQAFNRSERTRKDKESKRLMTRALARRKKQQEREPGFFERILGGASQKRDELLGALGKKKGRE